MTLEERVKILEDYINTVEFAEKVKHLIFIKRSNVLPSAKVTSYPVVAGAVSSPSIPDDFQEGLLDGKRILIPIYYG